MSADQNQSINSSTDTNVAPVAPLSLPPEAAKIEEPSLLPDIKDTSVNKKIWPLLLAVFVLGVFSFLAGGFLFGSTRGNSPSLLKEPEIFVAEEVTSTERQDLAVFAQTWQQALANNLTFDDYKQLALTSGGRFANVPVLRVGQETLYGNDLNYLALFYAFDDYVKDSPLSESALNKLTNMAMEDSMWLQKGAEAGLFKLNNSFFDSVDKNYTQRNQLVSLSKQALMKAFVPSISGEAISIWFKNTTVPISIEEGKRLAREKIDKIYTKLQSGAITFVQAGEEITNDKEIGLKIDPDYLNNAYYSFSQTAKEDGPFSSEELNNEAWALGEGQMSKVITAKEIDTQTGLEQEYMYMIIKINQRQGEARFNNADELTETFIGEISRSGQE